MTATAEDDRRETDAALVARARKQLEQIDRTLAEAQRVRREVVPRLRRAGLLRGR